MPSNTQQWVWIESLAYALLGLGFKSNKSDPSLFTPSVVTAHLSLIQKIITKLNPHLSHKLLGELDNILGIEVKHLMTVHSFYLKLNTFGIVQKRKVTVNFPSMGRLCS